MEICKIMEVQEVNMEVHEKSILDYFKNKRRLCGQVQFFCKLGCVTGYQKLGFRINF